MEVNRKPFQGVTNIIRFNYPYFVSAFLLITVLLFVNQWLPLPIQKVVQLIAILSIISVLISLFASYYIYDYSSLYQLNWLPNLNKKTALNVSAGFDETSEIIRNKYPEVKLTRCDFYDSKKHTEKSIERARKAYPISTEIIQVSTQELPFEDNYFDAVMGILSIHEIRNTTERIQFFNELKRVTKPNGHIYVTEHLRDLPNFLIYTIGFFHFLSKSEWLRTFKQSHLKVINQLKTTPFITTFILEKNDNSL